MAEKIFTTPFAFQGDREVIPDATQPDGSVSFNQGFGFDYERPNDDPAYKPFPRDPYNWLMGVITEAIGEIQIQGAANWSVAGAPYPMAAEVYHEGGRWRSAIGANDSEPGTNSNWVEVDAVPGASELVAGVLKIATAALAQGQTNDTTALTPKKLADAFMGSNQLLTTHGFQKIPGDLILQFGRADGGASSSGTITFPLAFPNECIICLAADNTAIGTPALAVGTSPTRTVFTWQQASGAAIAAFSWFALGH